MKPLNKKSKPEILDPGDLGDPEDQEDPEIQEANLWQIGNLRLLLWLQLWELN
jgi:hypothetical protein